MKGPALALLLWAVHAAAQAWSLGALSVRSGVGQPLIAEVEVRDLAPDQAPGLQIQLASAAQYQAAGLSFPTALTNAQVSLFRRPDGRVFARISTTQAVSEPLLDVLLQARQGGRAQQREYTAVMETPARLPVLTDDDSIPVVSSQTPGGALPGSASGGASGTSSAPVTAEAPAPSAVAASRASAASERVAPTVKVKPGDTLGAIALTHKPEGVSLDQMLVALFQANPGAFVDGNMNRLRAGSELTLPSGAQASGENKEQASSTVTAHTEDFNRYRQRLAQQPARVGAAPLPSGGAPNRAQVSEGRGENTGSQDRLVLSQATAQAQQAAAQLAQDNQAKELAARHSELSRNLRELQALQKSLPTAAPAAAASTSSASSAPTAAASAAPAGASASASSLAPTSMAASGAASSAAAAAGAAPIAAAAVAVVSSPGSPVLRAWLDSPVMLPLAGLLLALMVGVVLYRARTWKRQPGLNAEDL